MIKKPVHNEKYVFSGFKRISEQPIGNYTVLDKLDGDDYVCCTGLVPACEIGSPVDFLKVYKNGFCLIDDERIINEDLTIDTEHLEGAVSLGHGDLITLQSKKVFSGFLVLRTSSLSPWRWKSVGVHAEFEDLRMVMIPAPRSLKI